MDYESLLADFFESLRERAYARHTLYNYRSDLRVFTAFFQQRGLVDISSFGSQEYSFYQRYLEGKKTKNGEFWSLGNQKRNLSSVRGFLGYLYSRGLCRGLAYLYLSKTHSVTEPKSLTKFLQRAVKKTLEGLRGRAYAQKTIATYRGCLLTFVRWVQEKEDIQELSELTIQKLQDYMFWLSVRPSSRSRGNFLAPSTRSSHRKALFHLFHHLFKCGKLLTNPVYQLEPPRVRKTLPRDVLSSDEVLRLLSKIDFESPRDIRNRAAFELLYGTGLRRAELEKLNLESMSFGERLLQVEGKGDKPRVVPVGVEALRCLDHYVRASRPELNRHGSQALFLSTRGGRLNASALLRDLKTYARAAGIKKNVTLHGLRHSFATHMLAGGADIRHIQSFLGHSSLSTTQIYTRVEVSDLKTMLDRCHPRDQF